MKKLKNKTKIKKAESGFKAMGALGKAGSIAGMAGTAAQIVGSNFGSSNEKLANTANTTGALTSSIGGIASGLDKGKVAKKGLKKYRKGGKVC